MTTIVLGPPGTGKTRTLLNKVEDYLKETNIDQVSKDEYLNAKVDRPVFCNLQTCDYLIHSKKNIFDLSHFIKFPKEYASSALEYLKISDVFISAHYWDPSSPKIFEKNHINQLSKLQVIGDITCDVDGSIPTTIKSTSIEYPNFYLDKKTMTETEISENNLAIMAVDNLPSELPRDSSIEFGDGVFKHVLPFLINEDDGRIKKATITKNGEFLPNYIYVKEYMNN